MGYLFCMRKEYWKHIFFSLLIIAGGVLSYLSIAYENKHNDNYDTYVNYTNLFVLGQVLNVLSQSLKEKVVRTIVVN